MRSVSVVLFCCALSASLDAASRITGVVIDASGAPVPGATVTAGTATTITGDDGTFDLTDAPDGALTVRATAAGFAPAVLVLTFAPGRTRTRATAEAGSHSTARFSGYGGTQRRGWSADAAGEWLRTDGTVIVGEEARGPVDVRAESDYSTGFFGAGLQYDDDLNTFPLAQFSVVDASGSQQLRRGAHAFVAVENLFDADYDVGRTPVRTIGWPRTVRVGVRVFLQ